jgi:hypothetical protein
MIIEDGGVRDSAYYSIAGEQWPQVRLNFERRLQLPLAAPNYLPGVPELAASAQRASALRGGLTPISSAISRHFQ